MSAENDALHEDWLRERCPNQLDADHAWGWINSKDAEGNDLGRNIFWLHRCNGKLVLGTIDIASGTNHQLISEDPLHVEASVACGSCSDHGWIREGKWIKA